MPVEPTPRLVLYGNAMWNSPYVLSCFVGLTEKRLAFDVRTVALHEGAQWAASYVETSFTARVPALVDGDFSLSELRGTRMEASFGAGVREPGQAAAPAGADLRSRPGAQRFPRDRPPGAGLRPAGRRAAGLRLPVPAAAGLAACARLPSYLGFCGWRL